MIRGIFKLRKRGVEKMNYTVMLHRLFRLYKAYLLSNGFVREVLAEEISELMSRNQINYEEFPEEIRKRISDIFLTYGAIYKAASPSRKAELEEELAEKLQQLNVILDLEKS